MCGSTNCSKHLQNVRNQIWYTHSLTTKGNYICVTCRSICNKDQDFNWQTMSFDCWIISFWRSWLLDLLGFKDTEFQSKQDCNKGLNNLLCATVQTFQRFTWTISCFAASTQMHNAWTIFCLTKAKVAYMSLAFLLLYKSGPVWKLQCMQIQHFLLQKIYLETAFLE